MKKQIQIITLFNLLISMTAMAQTNATSSDVTTTSAKVEESIPEFVKSAETAGDLRYHQQQVKQDVNDIRNIQRLRFRLGQTFKIQPDLKVTYRLMTGTSATSGNVTLGDSKTPGAPRQSIGLDRAFAVYNPADNWTLQIGKMPQIQNHPGNNQTFLDSNVAPEGYSINYKSTVTSDIQMNLVGGSFWIREKYDDAFGEDLTDSMLNLAQFELQTKLSITKINLYYAVFSYTDLRYDKPASFVAGATSAKGNTLDINGNYQWQYEVQQLGAEFKFDFKPVELSIYAEQLQNQSADDKNKALIYGAGIKYKNWSLQWADKKIESDSVFALYTESDFADGQTNAKGQTLSVQYKFNKNAQISYAQSIAQQNYDILPVDYKRSTVDLVVSF